ncbi:MAG TPA: potassium channel protein [Candidatus Scalindua sp.]|nr:potassium channel protein [Candidatus Scalindua sp.]
MTLTIITDTQSMCSVVACGKRQNGGSGYLFMGLTCGYGVIPWRAIATAGGLIAIFTLCVYFPFSKQGSLEHQGKEDITKQEWYRRLYNCFYFSVIIFTTVGLGDIKPKGGFKAWATIEGILGWLTMALFLVTLANVWMR